MSRRHPVEAAFHDDPPPWPWITKRQAAKVLGVDPDFLDGLTNNPIRACKRTGKTGKPITLFCEADVVALSQKMTDRG